MKPYDLALRILGIVDRYKRTPGETALIWQVEAEISKALSAVPEARLTVKTFDGDEVAIPVAASWVIRQRDYHMPEWLRTDHACADCAPGSQLLKEGFRCYYHKAKAALGELPPQRGSGS